LTEGAMLTPAKGANHYGLDNWKQGRSNGSGASYPDGARNGRLACTGGSDQASGYI